MTVCGSYGGVQKFIHDKQHLAVYVHCAAHNLNLVVNDAVSAVRNAQGFLPPCRNCMRSSVTAHADGICWHHQILRCRPNESVDSHCFGQQKAAERGDLKFQKLLQTFDFVLILVGLSKVLSAFNAASMYLQSKDADLMKAAHHLKTSFDDMSEYRNKFEDAVDEATRVWRLRGIEAN